MQHQQNPEANLEAYLILNALYSNYSHFLSNWIHSSKDKSKTYNQISRAKEKSWYLSHNISTWTVNLFESCVKFKKKSWIQMIGYKLLHFLLKEKNKTVC